jgi:hypothetical protein
MDRKESIRIHWDWYGYCRTCKFWDSHEDRKKLEGRCDYEKSPNYNEEVWSEGYCKCWESFDPGIANFVVNVVQRRPKSEGVWFYKNNYDGHIDAALVGRRYGRHSGPLQVFHVENDDWCNFDVFEKAEVARWMEKAKR